jgi:membrane-associated phospholipid phosphatase
MDEIISQSLMLIIGAPYLLYIITYDTRWLHVIIYSTLAIIIHDIIKRLSIGSNLEFLKRPQGANNCDLCSKNGDQSGKPGFPSGHLTSTVSFFTSIYLLFPEYRTGSLWVGIIYTLLMAWSRINKKCHTLLQTIAGTVLGFGVSVGLELLKLR